MSYAVVCAASYTLCLIQPVEQAIVFAFSFVWASFNFVEALQGLLSAWMTPETTTVVSAL